MVQFRPKARELIAKVVYYGPPLGGKTTNLRAIFAGYPQDTRGELIVVPTGSDRTIFFDFLPVDLGMLRGMRVRVQLYTVPGQVRYNATRQVVLRGVDGVVFVADSQRALMRNNRESWDNLKDNLILQGLTLAEVPHVVQYNKRDLKDILSVEELDELLNEYNAPFYEAIASEGIGVEETLQGMVKLVIRSLRERFQLDGEQALTQPVHMGLRGAAERELGPHPVGQSPWPETASPHEPLPPAEEVPSRDVRETTLVNYRPEESGPFDPFRTQAISSPPATAIETPSVPESSAATSAADRAVFEEATHPDLEAQIERLQLDREREAASPAPPEPPTPVTPVVFADEEPTREPEAFGGADTPDGAGETPAVGEPAGEAQAAPEPFAATGEVAPLEREEAELPASGEPPTEPAFDATGSSEDLTWGTEARTAGAEEPFAAASGPPVEPAPPSFEADAFGAPAPEPPPFDAFEPQPVETWSGARRSADGAPGTASLTEPTPQEPPFAGPAGAVAADEAPFDGFKAQQGPDPAPFAGEPVRETSFPTPAESEPPFTESATDETPFGRSVAETSGEAVPFADGGGEQVAAPPPFGEVVPEGAADTREAGAVEEPFAAPDAQPEAVSGVGDAFALPPDVVGEPHLPPDGEMAAAPAVRDETAAARVDEFLFGGARGPASSVGPEPVAAPAVVPNVAAAEPFPAVSEQQVLAPDEPNWTTAAPDAPEAPVEIGLGEAVAAVRAHGEIGVPVRAFGDEVEGLAGEAVPPTPAIEEELVATAPSVAVGGAPEEDAFGEPAWTPAAEASAASVVDEPFAPAAAPFDESPAVSPVAVLDAVDDVFAITPAPPRQVVVEPETVVVPVEISAVRRAAGRALAQYGEVRELELEVPVPGGWTGGRRMTLQLRLTLVPQEEDHDR